MSENEENKAAEGTDEENAPGAAPGGGVDERRGTVDELAKRVAALGEEDELERQARIEEEKLAQRKSEAKKAKKKGALENAASKKLEDIGSKPKKKKVQVEEEEDEPVRATATKPYSDPLIDQARRIGDWADKNKQTVAYGVLAIVAGGLGFFGYKSYQVKKENEASQILSKAFADEQASIGDEHKHSDDEEESPVEDKLTFKDEAARQEAAITKYRSVTSTYPGTGAAIVARLAEGGVLLDQGKSDEAARAFSEVRASTLAQADAEVRGRALEGLGFALELKGQSKEALAAFKDMENSVDIPGFKELAMYHQARCHEALGEKDKAKEILLNVRERMGKPTENIPFGYLKRMVDDRLRAIDPKSIPEAPAGLGAGGGDPMKQIQEMMRKAQQRSGGGHP